MSSLSIDGVCKSFGPVRVLDEVGLEVQSGTLTAILGPSGCGKTTLLRIVAGFARADAGTIAFDGKPVSGPGLHVASQRRRVGYVAQEGALFPHLDIGRNVAFGLSRRARRDTARIQQLLDLVGLDPSMSRRYPHELSGGQQQRVALARALAPEPSMVLLDEPFASLDAGLRVATGRAVADALRAAGATGVLVTHDQAEALSLADRVAVMRDGRIVQADTPERVYRAPADPQVATFVGDSVILPATVSDGVARCALGEVDVNGAQIPAHGDIVVLLRPEQIEIRPATETSGVSARVAEVTFFGHDADVRLQLAGGADRILARVHGTAVPQLGAVVRLAVHGAGAVYPTPAADSGSVRAPDRPEATVSAT